MTDRTYDMENCSVFIQYDSTDKIYVASIPELQGCMAHGSTQGEALKEINLMRTDAYGIAAYAALRPARE